MNREQQKNQPPVKKGRLKIFLGMAAGVGKTYSMLEEAQKKAESGVHVVVGVVNTHGRSETANLLKNLTIVPQKTLLYKEKEFQELDVDEVIRLKPDIALVDELAHSNIPGSKHLKRWEDVEEILEAGIDVYTTLNVQHIESYKDIVEQITGIKIRETVPDLILEKADEIICIDLTPAELLIRLKEGKVYTGDLPEIALRNFFQEDRLTALREMALRCTAEMVDLELSEMAKAIEKGKFWTPRERLLVAINHHPYSQQLIRTTRRLAAALHAPWSAVYVDNGEALDDEEAAMLVKNFKIARELGAEVITTQDPDIAAGIQRVAEQKRITQIIVGKSLRKKIANFFKRSPVDRLSQISSGIDIHIIRQSELYPHKKKRVRKKALSEKVLSYLHLIFWIAAITILSVFLNPFVGYRIVAGIFLLSILLLSLFFRRGHIFLAALLFALIWDFYFLSPEEMFKLDSAEDAGYIILLLLAALITGILTNRVRTRQELLRKKEQSTQAIYEIGRAISSAATQGELFQEVKEKLGQILQGTCEIIPRMNGGLDWTKPSPILENEKEIAVAKWSFENGKEAGWSTSTLPSVKNLFIPLKGFKEVVGILAFRPHAERALYPEEGNFLYTVAQQMANFLERSFFEKRERQNELIQQMEQIYAKVLQSISDELYRPLKVIQNAVDEFKAEKWITENFKLFTSLHRMEKTSDSLMRIAESATDMAKLSTGVVTFEKTLNRVDVLIDSCLKKLQTTLKNHSVKVRIQENLPEITFDFTLMSILLHHLLLNAVEFSPRHTTIEIHALTFDSTFALSVLDQGRGIPEDMMDLVFEKFYRVRGTVSAGLGLGLAIVKSIADIHHGWIQVQNREGGGTQFSLILPLE